MYFKILGYNLHSGSTSLRHKENLVGFRVSKFVFWSGIDETLINFEPNRYYERYIDEITFENELLVNYKSKIANKNVSIELPAEFISLYKEMISNKINIIY